MKRSSISLDDIVISDQLALRRSADHRLDAEISALHELAQELVRTPQAILDRLVELSLQLCRAQSGGINLSEDTADGSSVFRWHALKGRFADFAGTSAPRNFSPSGVVLDRQQPILVKEPERYYPYLALKDGPISEGLLAPLLGSDGTPVGTLWIAVHDPGRQFTLDDCDTLMRLAAFGSVGLALNQTAMQKDELLARQELMLREVNHRVSNSLQLASSILRLQGRRAKGEEAKQQLSEAADRILSIGMVHTRLYKTGDMSAVNISLYLKELCSDLMASDSGRAATRSFQVEVRAPEGLSVPPDMATKLGLIVNELVTNSFKYATGSPHCEVRLTRSADGFALSISDEGPGLPAGFDVQDQQGLGMKMVLSLVDQLGGQLTLGPTARGAHFVITVPDPA